MQTSGPCLCLPACCLQPVSRRIALCWHHPVCGLAPSPPALPINYHALCQAAELITAKGALRLGSQACSWRPPPRSTPLPQVETENWGAPGSDQRNVPHFEVQLQSKEEQLKYTPPCQVSYRICFEAPFKSKPAERLPLSRDRVPSQKGAIRTWRGPGTVRLAPVWLARGHSQACWLGNQPHLGGFLNPGRGT